jgi:DeoR/GlpR family transcriptional regulator of sugar metabolism
MSPNLRQQQILDRLTAIQKEWKVEELAKDMRVSPITIRRDLDYLYRQKAVIRTFGGCLIDNRSQLGAYHERVARNFSLKQAIGQAAVPEIRKGDVLLLNDGSTTFQLAKCLGRCGPITVYTNSIVMVGELSRFTDVCLNVLGGTYHAGLFCLGGSLLERILESIEADTAFIGADGISPNGGCYCHGEDTARVAQLMMKHARRSILLADHTKVGAQASVRYAGLRDFTLWITTRGLRASERNNFKKLTGLKEIVAEL